MNIVEEKAVNVDFDKVESMMREIQSAHKRISELNVEETKLFEKKFCEFLFNHGWIQG